MGFDRSRRHFNGITGVTVINASIELIELPNHLQLNRLLDPHIYTIGVNAEDPRTPECCNVVCAFCIFWSIVHGLSYEKGWA